MLSFRFEFRISVSVRRTPWLAGRETATGTDGVATRGARGAQASDGGARDGGSGDAGGGAGRAACHRSGSSVSNAPAGSAGSLVSTSRKYAHGSIPSRWH